MSSRKQYEQIIEQGLYVLMQASTLLYDQKTIVDKLTLIGRKVSPASFNKICKGKRVGDKTLKLVAVGLQELIALELNYVFDGQTNQFIANATKDWTPTIVEQKQTEDQGMAMAQQGLRFHEGGRMPIPEKVKFMQMAQQEITIVGVRLRQFCAYFTARSDAEFKNHIIAILARGVNINCYLLSPHSTKALLYFEDRSAVFSKEKHGEQKTKEVINDFIHIIEELEQLQLKGKLRLYAYKHIPQNYFLVLDGDTYNGQMQVSHYLYGVLRSKTPIISIRKRYEAAVFKLYMKSLKAICDNASLIR